MLRYFKSFYTIIFVTLIFGYNPPKKAEPFNIPYEKFELSNVK